ncbi:VIT domain-containing protein [Flavobacterium covae]|uniref:VIT domain-containing protein n=1 Tax=Flavobacterium covae TaxID=2906076 RepID=UPI000745DCE3|nr:VIT domain-containing protein [Flavobacterium covae]AMA48424.1 TonB-dependent receptor [Flavobacterium covae]MCJ1809180.1 TonB-dependent receptor [Flavobacterium covae]
MFKKSFLFILLFISLYSWAQNPQLTVKDKDSSLVKLSQLKVQVKIVGNIAYTTTEMHFFNASTRPMEADLLFPLPEGISVSRYAIDINGKIREAVPVNKNKGKQVFEAVEHRRVDPGLLEKVEGNNFKTRIFPLLPNSERIVIIGYEQELSMLDKTYLGYQMMSSYTKAIDTFELNISVIGSDAQPKISNDGKEITIEKLGTTYQASIQQKNYIPKDKLLVKIPVTSSIPSVVTQEKDNQYYFYATMHLDGAKKAKTLPKSIGLIWDVSLSSHKRDSKKELELLDLYFKKMPSVAVSLYLAGFHFEKKADYVISNGNWSELRKTLETITYDGGTNYTKIELPKKDEILFFTDGLSTLSDATLPETKQPLYTITSSVTANYAFLNYQAIKTGGAFLNLNTLKTEDALTLLTHRNFLFYGIKNNNTVVETYPMEGTPVTPNFSVAGISLLPTNQVTLLFGYDAEHLTEQTLTIATNKETNTDLNIEKLWAQKKIANLEIQYNKNAEEIETLGKKFGIITPNTSLIVLETVNDYILYDIVPPAELREEFDKIKKTQLASTEAKTKSNWENIDRYHSELDSWWKKNIKFVKKTPPPTPKGKKKGTYRTVAPRDRMYDRNAAVTIDQPTGDIDKMEVKEESMTANESQVDRAKANLVISKNESERNIVNALQGRTPGISLNQKTNTDTDGYSTTWSNTNSIKTNSWNPDRVYLKALEKVAPAEKYALYLKLREVNQANPSYYFDVATHFYNTGDTEKALLVLSNIAELDLENHQLYKSLLFVLRQWGANELALHVAKKIVTWRTHEPQSYRDLALTLEDNKQYQEAYDTLLKSLETNYYGEMSGVYQGIEDIILMDINRLAATHNIKTGKLDKKYVDAKPVDLRIILNWNQMDTDIDLHIIEPTNEECYYAHKDTEIGARFSKDFTQGYGPEQYLLRNAIKGKYQIKTNYYGETKLTETGPATVLVEIYIKDKNGKIVRKLQTIQLGKVKENQNLAEITID